MKKTFLILTLLFFTLSSSASAGMAGCWFKSAQKAAEAPCHPAKDVKKSATDCCDDMAVCKTPVVCGPGLFTISPVKAAVIQPAFNDGWNNFAGAGPPTPPPRYSL